MRKAFVMLLLAVVAQAAWAAGRVFFDGAEDGTINAWQLEGDHGPCTVVTSAADGLTGPYSGSRFFQCNATSSDYQSMIVPAFSMNNEVLYRFRIRVDSNHDRTGGDPRGSPAKKLRMFYWTGNFATYNDNYGVVDGASGGMRNEGLVDGTAWSTYYGDAVGDRTQESGAGWRTVELYWNKSTGNHKVWHDDVLVVNVTLGSIQGQVGEGGNMSLMSNWEDIHDSVNYTYFDDVEVFTDTGTGLGSGSLSNGDAVQGGGGGDTSPPVISNPLPSGAQAIGTTSVTLQITTNEAATCRYNTTDVAYASMSNTFASTGGTTHQQANFAVAQNTTYTRYTRCIDGSANANTSSSLISFSIPINPPVISLLSCQDVQAPTTTSCAASLSGGTPSSYSWTRPTGQCGAVGSERCAIPSGAPPQSSLCSFGGACRLCLAVSNASGSSGPVCDDFAIKYVQPTGFGAN